MNLRIEILGYFHYISTASDLKNFIPMVVHPRFCVWYVSKINKILIISNFYELGIFIFLKGQSASFKSGISWNSLCEMKACSWLETCFLKSSMIGSRSLG